ncbi:MAG: hypothetical protein A2252_03020 [Elusimicrobia bacterium RIFOXYA2_FULL_39_19]|nr:MAG: hypothetical protein A2252_03020 [Elusimicrobia bacterium RIFOXYA2_FULL_39_19]
MPKSQYKTFDRSKITLFPFDKRVSDLSLHTFPETKPVQKHLKNKNLTDLSRLIIEAKKNNASVVLMMGAHVIRSGVSPLIIDLMEKGFITHIAMNGAGPIHDFELTRFGKTTESVAKYIKSGQFGLWKETGEINDIINKAYQNKIGLGEAIGKHINNSNYKYKNLSILEAGYRLKVPVTVHVGIGYDIIHEHPNCSGAALGDTSYRDFLIFANTITNLEKGVLLCFGSAVMGPEVFLKALSMARNVSKKTRKPVNNFTTAVFDLYNIDSKYGREARKTDPRYYFRPWKTLLVRTVSNGGGSFYFNMKHAESIPSLHYLLTNLKK